MIDLERISGLLSEIDKNTQSIKDELRKNIEVLALVNATSDIADEVEKLLKN